MLAGIAAIIGLAKRESWGRYAAITAAALQVVGVAVAFVDSQYFPIVVFGLPAGAFAAAREDKALAQAAGTLAALSQAITEHPAAKSTGIAGSDNRESEFNRNQLFAEFQKKQTEHSNFFF